MLSTALRSTEVTYILAAGARALERTQKIIDKQPPRQRHQGWAIPKMGEGRGCGLVGPRWHERVDVCDPELGVVTGVWDGCRPPVPNSEPVAKCE
jgi:hypothetical protein